jgi:F-type H+-transporting ATPase subunit gamma
MSNIELLRDKINSVQDLQSVVKTMKALAAVNIHQYQKAVESLADYNHTIEMGLQVILKHRFFQDKSIIFSSANTHPQNTMGVIIFGSDQGLCGQFNEQIISHYLEQVNSIDIKSENIIIVAVGSRLIPLLETSQKTVNCQFPVPNSVNSITSIVVDILLKVQQLETENQISQIQLFYNQSLSSAFYQPTNLQLIPLDFHWLKSLEKQPWVSPILPTFSMDEDELFSALIRQYLFISLYRAIAESLASENASRLSSMQAAEKNIEDNLSELNAEYRRLRQSSITEELLDIIGGFEALTQHKKIRN